MSVEAPFPIFSNYEVVFSNNCPLQNPAQVAENLLNMKRITKETHAKIAARMPARVNSPVKTEL